MSLFIVDIASPDQQALELITYLNRLLVAKESGDAKEDKVKGDDGVPSEKNEGTATEKPEGAFFVEAKGLLERKAYKDLVAKLVDAQPTVLETAPEKGISPLDLFSLEARLLTLICIEVEACFNLVFSLLSRLDPTTRASLLAKLVSITTTQDPSHHPLLRLRLCVIPYPAFFFSTYICQ